ncbi:hypothetical protein Tco_1023489 [Tanacetum coccineum]
MVTVAVNQNEPPAVITVFIARIFADVDKECYVSSKIWRQEFGSALPSIPRGVSSKSIRQLGELVRSVHYSLLRAEDGDLELESRGYFRLGPLLVRRSDEILPSE